MEAISLKIVETYLHFMLCNYLKGNFTEAKLWQQLLRKCNDTQPELFFELDKFDIKRLKTISQALDNDQYSMWLHAVDDTQTTSVITNSNEIESEKDVVKMLLHNENSVCEASGFKLKFAGTEQETQFGNIDIMAYSKLYAHPIEVKHDMATHAVVGQVLKYMKHYLFRVNYGYFRDVIGIVIAKRYSDTAYQELKKNNVVMLVYQTFNDAVKLSRI